MLPNVTKMLPKKSKKSQKEPKFYCLCCDFTTSKKGNWERHLATQKHQKKMLPIVTKTLPKKSKKSQKSVKIFVCEHCNKEYKSRKGLWGHKKKCMSVNLENNAKVEELKEKLNQKEMNQMLNDKIEMIQGQFMEMVAPVMKHIG